MRTLMICLLGLSCSSLPSPTPSAEASDPQRSIGPDCVQLPVGPPDGVGYRVAQGFGRNRHLGEDWNGVGGGNTDLGDPVYAMADGRVSVAEDFKGGWGRVVRIVHRLPSPSGAREAESLYAHLDEMGVQPGQVVARGQQIGTIGDAHGAYVAHLHLEVRDTVGLPLGPGYSIDTAGYTDPRKWVAAHTSGCPES